MEAVIKIVCVKETKNEDTDLLVKEELINNAYCQVKKVRMSEFYAGQQSGIRPTLQFTTRTCDFFHNAEVETDVTYIIYNNRKYNVLRTYLVTDDVIEVTCIDK